MKKLKCARIIVLVLSLALLIGAAFAISASAEDSASAGKFGGISVAYGEKVAIRVAVNATEEEIKSGDVVVSYELLGEEKTAEFFEADENGTWVITEGIAAYNLGEVVTFFSTVDGVTVEEGRSFSVAQFLYTMLYTNDTLSDEYRSLYTSLINYGEAAQIALNKNTDRLVTDSTIVSTDNASVSIKGGKYTFAPAADIEITPVWLGETPAGSELCGWNIIDNGEATAAPLSFTAKGVVKVVSPIFAEIDPTPFILENGGFENGLEGWTLVGNIGNVSADKAYWTNENDGAGYSFGMDGDYMFSAYAEGASEAAVGTLTSSSFTVGGSGFVTFKLGAMRDGNYVYVDVVDNETKQILARYYNGLWAETTEGVKSGCTLIPYKADLSAFMGKEVFFRISDNADENYALFFLDSFNTYYITEPDGFNAATPVNYEVEGTIYDLFNGGFEMGTPAGWWNKGEPGVVTGADAYFDGTAYGKEGAYLYSGVEDHGTGIIREGNVGTLTSSAFLLGGNGYITYMLGGGNEFCYVQVIDAATGETLARYRQQEREAAILKTYVADLSAYIGRTVRIQLVDNATREWGCVSFDNVVTYYNEIPEGITAIDIKHEILNGSFESGNLEGWKMNITWSGDGHNTLGWVQSEERAEGWYTTNNDRKDGNNLFTFYSANGDNCENNTGTLESSIFTLKKDSFVSFRFGAGGTRGVRIELVKADGTVVASFYNEAEGKKDTEMYAYYYQYTGENADCFFRVVDEQREGDSYRCFVIDDFRVNLEAAPEGFMAAIQ